MPAEGGAVSGVLVALLAQLVSTVSASAGDAFWFFQKCARICWQANCTAHTEEAFLQQQPLPLRLLRWTCADECDYTCMWQAVDAFQKDHSNIPQFYGKWPFIRVLGVQEPASTVCSLLNLLAHLYGLRRFRRVVTSKAPMYWVTHFNCAISVNAWIWSTVFHSRDWPVTEAAVNAWLWAAVFHIRDYPFTEKMDYFCAISLVLSSVFVLCARVFGTRKEALPKLAACAAALLSFFAYHVHYLAFVKFDYGYNMKANVTVGVLNSLGWLTWCGLVFRAGQRYVWKAVVCILAVNALLLLEVGDFPPIWWVFDAHSLWHLGTAPVALFWYSFMSDDCKFTEQRPDLASLSAVLANRRRKETLELGDHDNHNTVRRDSGGKEKLS